MLIRCEKCSTLYELDESLLPPQGAPVQCSKCQFVFKAYPVAQAPPQAPPPDPGSLGERAPREDELSAGAGRQGEALVREGGALAAGPPMRRIATPAPAAPGSVPARSTPVPVSGGTGRSAGGGDEPQFTADGRPIRKVPFPSGDAGPPVARAPAAKAAPRGTPAAASTGRALRWIVPIVVILIIAAAIVAWRVLATRGNGRGERHRPAAQSMLNGPRPSSAAAEAPVVAGTARGGVG